MAVGPGLVWLASYPKSGNTWFRLIVAHLAGGPEHAPTINEAIRHSGFAASRAAFEAATMLESDLLFPDDIDLLRPRLYDDRAAADGALWIKVHDAYSYLADGQPMLGTAPGAAIYLVRDPRDVAISFAHFSNISIDDSIAYLGSTGKTLGRDRLGGPTQLRQKLLDWSGHVESWTRQTCVPVLAIRYEDLSADPVAEVARALRFAGQDALREDVERAVARTSFDALQRQEAELGFVEGRGATPFFRSGRSGGWREILSREQRRRIEDGHAAVMERFGYARD
jgi:hypothetical protein